ncbi:MAG: ATP synthase F1 subunit epsilon [Bacteroidia bacterium]|nr:ATP synthase F1 subunit epsilon [Bacteroidia bacterium]
MFAKVITPDENVFEGEIIQAKFPGTSGEFEVLENHAPLISTLETGKLMLKTPNNERQEFQIEGGVVEILHNQVTVLVESLIRS